MKIERLGLERYGIFTDRSLAFRQDAALHVVLGPNEGGKTSALSAIGDLLFGFGGRTDYDFRHESKNLRIGGTFRHSDGTLISARRRKGNKNTLIDADEQALPDDILVPLLSGVSRETFSREFGLTAQALREGGQELFKAGGRLAETLAASSAGMTALSQVREKLQREAEDLFTPRKSAGKPFYVAADWRDRADKALRDAIVTREAVRDLEAAVADARVRLDELNDAHARSGGELSSWQRTLRVRSKLSRLESVAAELIGFADLPPVPPQLLVAWRSAFDADVGLLRKISELDATDAVEAAEIAAMAIDDGVLAEASAIDALRERLGAVREWVNDLPKRRQARDEAERSLTELARRLGLGSVDLLLQRQPTDAAVARARDAIAQLGRATQALAEAEARQVRTQGERNIFATEAGQHQAVLDVEQIRQRFDALGDIPAQVDRHRRDLAVQTGEIESLECAVAALDPAPAGLEQLRGLPLPDVAVIAEFTHDIAACENEIERLGDTLATTGQSLADTEAELARLRAGGTVPRRTDLLGVRQLRDIQLDALGAALDGDREARKSHFAEVVQSSHAIDDMTDALLTDTQRAALHEDALLRLAALRSKSDGEAVKLQSLQASLTTLTSAWSARWAPAGVVPRSPAEMQSWRSKVEEILGRLGRLDAHRVNLDVLAAEIGAGRTALIGFLASLGASPDTTLPSEILFREAKARVDALQTAWADAKAREVKQQQLERDLSEAAAALAKAQAMLTAQRDVWPAAMTGIGLAESAIPAEAEAALGVWQLVPVPKTTREGEGHRVETMESNLRAFDADVFRLVDRVAPQFRSDSAQESLAKLSAALADARKSSETRMRLSRNAEQRVVTRQTLTAQRQAGDGLLDEACRTFGVDREGLSDAIARLVARHEMEREQVALRRDVHEIADGRDEDALRREREGLDFDLLPGDIARGELRQSQLLKDIAEASVILHEKERLLGALLKGRNAPALAAERAEAGAELVSIAERWLLRAAAARLASRAIERHRALVQDPLIARASTLFSMATNDAFAGLVIAYGDDDQPVLVAKRQDGERVPVAGLSEGTRDQLFLALRLALLERRSSEALPFIGDDLLASFDDARALATLRLLATAGQQRQIILFTHHRHIADLARSLNEQEIDVICL
ncbi:AAA family ATPase [Bradyrhizobium oligotrophicum]|uniref:AAA family ATPase n=1 Tax=Bradyrhizobium oligotrophicum TaxID=44255 RepID=UPI003EB89558